MFLFTVNSQLIFTLTLILSWPSSQTYSFIDIYMILVFVELGVGVVKLAFVSTDRSDLHI